MIFNQGITCRVQVYALKIKTKRARNYQPTEQIYSILKKISQLKYSSIQSQNKRRKFGNYQFAIDLLGDFPELNENLTRIDFAFGRETRESFPTKKIDGQKSRLNLPDDCNLCFDTRGSFLFRKINGEWNCLILLERRFTTAGIHKIEKYLEIIEDNNISLDSFPITTEADLRRKINSVTNLDCFIIKNQNFEFLELNNDDGFGTIYSKSRQNDSGGVNSIKEMRLVISEGENTFEKVMSLAKNYLKKTGEININDIKKLIDDTELVLVKKGGGTVNLLNDMVIFEIKVKFITGTRDFDSNDFLTKLYQKITNTQLDKLFNLSRQLNNSR